MAIAFVALVSLQNNLRLIYNHPRHSFSFEKKQIDSLSESVEFLIEFMESFDDSRGAIKEAAEALERRIAHAAHAAEDIIESHVVDQICGGSTLGGKTRPRFLLDLQKAIDDMDFVRRKAANVQKWRSGFKAEQPTISAAAATSSTPMASEKNRMVGFDDELLRLLHLLTGVSSSRRVIPIVGMGGIGKTTLAKNASRHPYIVQYFDFCLWATVSQEYSVQKILTELVSQIREKTSFLSKLSTGVGSVDELSHELYKSLFGRRYLIILDDMWSVVAWDKIKVFFPDTRNGSRIAVTTRQSDVASDLGSLHLDVGFLDADSSWDLFCENAFAEQCCTPKLEAIGKKIVGKCGRLPLAIVVAGGHLRKSSRTTEYWENIVNNMVSVLDFGENEQCLNILSLSYRHLPTHLKPCFLFFGVFPEDQEIPMSDIVNLWIAEGFIEKYVSLSLEDVALKYLVDLTERNLISYHKSWQLHHGFIYVFRVHDLIRELCLRIAKKDEFLSVFDTRRAINKERRLVINGRIFEVDHQPKIFNAPRSEPPVRSLICEGQLSFDLKLLRVLNKVNKASMKEVDFQQVNLRYLKVDIALKSYLPSSISLLWNLQTLIITGVFRSIIAPYEIWEMLQLRHIEVDPISLLDPLPVDSSDRENDLVLRNLHTLSKVVNFRLSEEVCRRIPNIKKLELSYCDEPSSYYCLQNLGCFQKLEKMECYFDGSPQWRDFALSLTFPSSLTQLNLSDCRLDWEDLTTMVGSLPYLETLLLFPYSVIGSAWTAGEGGFPCLEMLLIDSLDLIYWNAEKFHFPVLKYLILNNLSKLDEFPLGIGEIPTLQWIVLEYCSMSSSLSAMRMLVEQEEQGNEELQLQVTFRGDEETLEGFKQKVEEEGLRSKNLHLKLENVKTRVFGEKFRNEKFIVNVIKAAIRVSVAVPVLLGMDDGDAVHVKSDDVKIAIDELMDGGGEGTERRERARKLGEAAKRAVEEGGSSYLNMTQLNTKYGNAQGQVWRAI